MCNFAHFSTQIGLPVPLATLPWNGERNLRMPTRNACRTSILRLDPRPRLQSFQVFNRIQKYCAIYSYFIPRSSLLARKQVRPVTIAYGTPPKADVSLHPSRPLPPFPSPPPHFPGQRLTAGSLRSRWATRAKPVKFGHSPKTKSGAIPQGYSEWSVVIGSRRMARSAGT
jgi:hypothetical protein